MKVGLINYHYAYNYGAVLQCVALKRVIEKQGHVVSVIDYRPTYQQQYYVPYPNPIVCAGWAWNRFKYQGKRQQIFHAIGRVYRVLSAYRDAPKRKHLMKSFSQFQKKNLNMTHRYDSFRELETDPPDFDVYICGSDQLWNPNNTWGIDPAYFVCFGSKKVLRIAYAVSPCELDCNEYSVELKNYGNRIDAISLRESEKLEEIQCIMERYDVEVCPDPTLLLQSMDYEIYEENTGENEPYILVYSFHDEQKDACFFAAVKNLAEMMKMKVVDVSLDELQWPYSICRSGGATPGQFLTYIKNASYVLTNSFHGTVFSIIYHKVFMTMVKSKTGSRMKELLNDLGLQNRIMETVEDVERVCDIIDYHEIDRLRENLITQGNDFLQRSFQIGDLL